MKTHRRILHVAIPARTIPVEALRGALGSDPMVRAARGILVLALVLGSLGSLGTDATASAGHRRARPARARPPPGQIRRAGRAVPVKDAGHSRPPPMYVSS